MTHNPVLSNLALQALANLREKQAFVPMSPDIQQQMAAGGQQGAPAAPQGAQPAPVPAPADPAAAAPAPQPDPNAVAPAPQAGGQVDQVRAAVRDEIEAAENKPKKPSTDERLTAVEGMVLRLLERLGELPPGTATKPPEPDKMQPVPPLGPAPASAGQADAASATASGAVPPAAAPAPGATKTASVSPIALAIKLLRGE